MKNDIEAMTLFACKAAGWRDVWAMDFADDDGDSRMLQVACKIALHFEVIGGEWCAEAYSQPDGDGSSFCMIERLHDDAKKAVRMAVLRCASMIGGAME